MEVEVCCLGELFGGRILRELRRKYCHETYYKTDLVGRAQFKLCINKVGNRIKLLLYLGQFLFIKFELRNGHIRKSREL